MDLARIRSELTGSLGLLWTAELWLWSGAVAVLAGFGLWVGATGAALNYGAEFAGIDLSVIEWSTATTVVLALVSVLWVLVPAAFVAYLVDGRLTNVSGNVHTHYRVGHPSLLVVPILAVYAILAGVGYALDEVPVALTAALSVVGLVALIRTVAYSYRVFSLSVPLVVQSFLFASLAVTVVALLTGTAAVAGREAFVEAAASGVGDLLGVDGVVAVVTGTTAVGNATVPTLPGLTAVTPAGLAVLYLLVQSLAGLVARLRKPDVPRSELRTGQRYPDFARPVTRTASDGTTADTTTPNPSGSTADNTGQAGTVSDNVAASDSGDDATADASDEVSHTKVFTAPDDGDFDADVPGVDEDALRCPTCRETFDADADFAYCPTCGGRLEPE